MATESNMKDRPQTDVSRREMLKGAITGAAAVGLSAVDPASAQAQSGAEQPKNPYGGGPGTVALHGWPDPAVFGHPVSHGCVRVPAAALRALARIPLGSAVTITG